MNTLVQILLMGPSPENQNPLMSFLPLILIILVFYLFMIRPQMKRQKELRNFRESLSKGDKIITTGGIHGKILSVSDAYIVIETEGETKLRIDKSAVLKEAADLEKK
ncbi:MAG: preprotein translocase subunit YajC [Bacteroidales bacterium]